MSEEPNLTIEEDDPILSAAMVLVENFVISGRSASDADLTQSLLVICRSGRLDVLGHVFFQYAVRVDLERLRARGPEIVEELKKTPRPELH